MIYAHVKKDDPRVVSAVQWAARHWSVDENPGMGTKGLYYYYYIMAKALSLMQTDSIPGATGEPIPWKQQLMGKLVKVQQADGSWMNTDNTFWEGDAALVTAYGVLTLQYALAEADFASVAALPSVPAAK
jgi:squalene-hopene/tetraprenyl-beta-curcumene cyclase